MWFRVLSFAAFCGSVASSATAGTEMAPGLAVPPGGVPDRFVAAAYRAHHGGELLHPLDASQGHAMWDPLGSVCIDGGGWDDPFPGGKGAALSPPFCIPQPCMRRLDREELSRDVIGRPVQEVEWQKYQARYAQACGGVAEWPVTALNLALDEDTLAPDGPGISWIEGDPIAVVLSPKGSGGDRWRGPSSSLDPLPSSERELLPEEPAVRPLTPVPVPPALPLLLAGFLALRLARR